MKKYIITAIVVIIIAAFIWLIIAGAKKSSAKAATSPEGVFATCLKDNGAKFYGAIWCPHCLEQKSMFKRAYKLLPYIECSPQRGTLLPICEAEKIEGFPTWDFADTTRLSNVLTFAQLSTASGCPIPAELESVKDVRP